MKNILIILLMIIAGFYFQIYGQYTVKLRIGEIRNPETAQHPGEWATDLYADIFDNNNNLVPPSSDYYYFWQVNNCDGNGFHAWSSYGYGISAVYPDGHNSVSSACDPSVSFQTYYALVTVTIDGNEYDSEPIRLPDNNLGVLTQTKIGVFQKRENQNSVGYIGSVMHQGKSYN